MSRVSGLSSGEVLLGGAIRQGWWLVVDDDGADRILAGPFSDRAEAGWAAGPEGHDGARPVYGVRRADGVLARRPSPQDWAWLAHLGGQLDRLPEDWDADLSDDDPLTTLVVEIAAVLAEAGLPLHDAGGSEGAIGGACLVLEPALGGVVVGWRQHDRVSVDQVHGAAADAMVQQVMNRALGDVLRLRGFAVESFGDTGGAVVRWAA
ncbi:hypothetical protein [Geodermatophilus sp. CPCC 205761]|uniref:hypothetical protein n=1 Tax=Geodermatophilus sp. CPCC 205761 TaxID=2936597 RepID=UPI003EEA4D3B